jgi:hypothetical protein
MSALNKQFKATLQKSPNRRSSFMALGDGRHVLPIKVDARRAIGRETGDTVTIRPNRRLDE